MGISLSRTPRCSQGSPLHYPGLLLGPMMLQLRISARGSSSRMPPCSQRTPLHRSGLCLAQMMLQLRPSACGSSSRMPPRSQRTPLHRSGLLLAQMRPRLKPEQLADPSSSEDLSTMAWKPKGAGLRPSATRSQSSSSSCQAT